MERIVKTRRVVVTSDRMNKSRVGELVRTVKHPVFGKYIKRTSKFMFHDEKNESHIGDEVTITECAPKSANKSFQLVSIEKRAELTEVN
ncbi:MAG: 30S ribosomal protein S17 [Deltaproteobacteria bacterium]|nr:30S ribosomal protein S17 [Deltaproteobacteria bacterium]